MKKILFPTDFSETSFNAFKYALELANFLKAEIQVLHIFESKTLSSSRLSPKTIDEFKENIELKEFEHFKSFGTKFRAIAEEIGRDDINFQYILEYGYLLPVVQKKIKEEGIDLVVMGTNNDKDFETSVLGSNTYNVILHTDVPTLCVPKIAVYKKIEKMVFSTAFSPKDVTALKYFIDLANDNDCEAKCVYVDYKNRKYDNLLNAWKTTFSKDNIEFVILKGDNPVKEVTDYIERENVGLLTTVKYNKTFFESIFTSSFTKKISNRVNIPLLVIHN
ncbi:universal stress protein [Flavobacterium agricola]|uniref:Universal stress protein n=1 Tax=Flavobacterium agricola TaxID=2870839 RepID=A0ABY6M3P9_9FLAO|nr:universal stress protein [Flavobacterium agricola]UYW02053.1 universal stress protein [Flavobacterium agricola]